MFKKENLVSYGQTFLATVITQLALVITTLPEEVLSNPNTWTTSFIAGILVATVRAVVKSLTLSYVDKV